jgi:thiosulfate dehydrogenase
MLDAMNVCLEEFMGGRKLAPWEEAAGALYQFLDAHSPAAASPASPLTIVRQVTSLSALAGDVHRGAEVFSRACVRCHGQAHTGEGRLKPRATVVPEPTVEMFGAQARAVVVEKIRHGKFFNIGGAMPLYTVEVMSDEEIGDLLAYLGL